MRQATYQLVGGAFDGEQWRCSAGEENISTASTATMNLFHVYPAQRGRANEFTYVEMIDSLEYQRRAATASVGVPPLDVLLKRNWN